MRVGIVGGGITGLALVHTLARAGIDARVFEKEDRPGGVIRSIERDGRLFEMGPQRTRLVPTVKRLVEELDLGERVLTAREGARLYMFARGRLRVVPRRPGELPGSSLLTPAGRLRLLAEPLTGGLRSGESVAGYFVRKTGEEAYRTLFGPLVSATFASDPRRMPARHSLPMILGPLGVKRSLLAAGRRWTPAGVPACTFRGGMSELTGALLDRHRDRVRLGAAASAIERDGEGLSLRLASGEVERFDRIVVTAPAAAAAGLLEALAPKAAEILKALRYNEVAVVALESNAPQSGLGFQSAFDAPWRTRGVTWAGSLFERPGAFTAYLGGGRDPEIAGWSDERIGALAAEEFEAIHGASAAVVEVGRARLPAYDESWDALAGLAVPDGVTLAANYLGRLGISARIAQAELLAGAWSEVDSTSDAV